jgi:hypothetical protein
VKIKFILLVPLRYNDDTEVSAATLRSIDDDLFVLAGGYTVAGEVEGAWKMEDGTKQVDRCAQYWVVIDDGQTEELKELVSEFARLLGQEAMYFERVDGFVEFVEPPADEN